MKMDFATVLGFVIGPILVVAGIAYGGSTLRMFVDVPSILIVGGGALAALLAGFPWREIATLPRVCAVSLFSKSRNPRQVIQQVVEHAHVARRDGVLALQNHAARTDDAFYASGLRMVIDGADREMIEQVMESELDAIEARHDSGRGLLECIGRYAPAFGIIGTLIGLVQMLSNMHDPKSIGAGMAVALLTTLYGALLSNLVALPMADKLAKRHAEEMLVNHILFRGILAIQAGDNPRVIEQKLRTVLPMRGRDASEPLAA
jgi:chemotaxis protein MotA